MIRAGDSIVNPVTGERLVFELTSHDTGGAYTPDRPRTARRFGNAGEETLRLAVVANHHFDVVRLPVVPHALQKLALVPGAPPGRALGYQPTYESTAGVAALA